MGEHTPATIISTIARGRPSPSTADRRPAHETSDLRGGAPTMPHSENFQRPKGLWGSETSNRSLLPQQFCTVTHLQDDQPHNTRVPDYTPSMGSLNRSAGRLLTYTHTQELAQVSCLHSQEQVILLPCPTIWPERSSCHIHHTFTLSSCSPSRERHTLPT